MNMSNTSKKIKPVVETGLNAIETIALSKAISDKAAKAAREGLESGLVDFQVRVVGSVNVAADQMIAPTASLMNEDFLVLVLRHAGITREAAMKAMKDAASEYLVGWTGSDEDKAAAEAARKSLVEEYNVESVAASFKAVVASLPQIPRKGAVKFEGTVELVK
jgi:hypothetical protein